jgi:hypothetical protein
MFKSIDMFGNSKQTWDTLRPTCKECLHESNMTKKEQITEYNKKYWEKTKKEQKEKNKKWRENNQVRMKQLNKLWLEQNKEHKKQKDAQYRKKNWEKKKIKNAEWQRKNYAKMKIDPKRRIELVQHKLKSNTSRRIREMLGQNKSEKCMDYVSCSIDKFRILLETKFQDGMSWNNYGENIDGGKTRAWHIDHKLPCSAFDLSNEIHKKACFHHKNLQPLWWNDNIRKHASFDKENFDNYIKWFIDVHVM